jgi:hypothetical protein
MEGLKRRQIARGNWKKKMFAGKLFEKALVIYLCWNWEGANCLPLLDGNGNGESNINQGLGNILLMN